MTRGARVADYEGAQDEQECKLNRVLICTGSAVMCVLGMVMSFSGFNRLQLHHTDPLTVQGEVRSQRRPKQRPSSPGDDSGGLKWLKMTLTWRLIVWTATKMVCSIEASGISF